MYEAIQEHQINFYVRTFFALIKQQAFQKYSIFTHFKHCTVNAAHRIVRKIKIPPFKCSEGEHSNTECSWTSTAAEEKKKKKQPTDVLKFTWS